MLECPRSHPQKMNLAHNGQHFLTCLPLDFVLGSGSSLAGSGLGSVSSIAGSPGGSGFAGSDWGSAGCSFFSSFCASESRCIMHRIVSMLLSNNLVDYWWISFLLEAWTSITRWSMIVHTPFFAQASPAPETTGLNLKSHESEYICIERKGDTWCNQHDSNNSFTGFPCLSIDQLTNHILPCQKTCPTSKAASYEV